jgi:N-acetylglucosamine-6-phosphate deacetylase
MLFIRNVVILTPDRTIENGAVLVESGRIQAVGSAQMLGIPDGATVLNGRGLLCCPGFIELQVNGGFGMDFTAHPETMWRVAEILPATGITSFLPTIITSPFETIRHAQKVLAEGAPNGWGGARPLGLHVEGPFLNPAKKGAHNPSYLRAPDVAAVAGWSPDTGVRLATLAPELAGAKSVVRALTGQGVIVAAGHSEATYDEGKAGIDAGIIYGTHIFNAMPSVKHRDPGLVGILLEDERVTVGMIPDGIHVHPMLVKLIWDAIGNRLNLVTDAMAALGMSPGVYDLGDYQVTVTADRATLSDGTLAGSIVGLDAGIRNLMAFTGCSLSEALPTITTTPARLLGLDGYKGKIAVGYDADLVLLTTDLRVVTTIVAGEIVYQAPEMNSHSDTESLFTQANDHLYQSA